LVIDADGDAQARRLGGERQAHLQCLLLLADSSLTAHKVALALSQVIAERGTSLDRYRYQDRIWNSGDGRVGLQFSVQLDFIRPGKPVENGYIESFNGCAMNA
jgi:putative transposase